MRTAAIQSVLRPLALAGKRPLATTVGSHIVQVLGDAYLDEWREDDGSEAVTAVVRRLPNRKREVQHARALHWRDVCAALAQTDAREAKGANETIRNAGRTLRLAMRFMILTASRQIEVRKATWDQFAGGMTDGVWTGPASMMKASREHRVPLSTQAVDVLARAKVLNPDSELVFPGSRGMLGTSSMKQLLQLCDVPCVPHGFRSSFATWAQEQGIEKDLREFALAHVEGSATVAAYARSDLLDLRRPVMQSWADAIS